mmetsp:Transcript_119159/g.186962  ORF Transcript_119159/g.186962 Transcript_119159/m.186962 type:complete len:272 (-) Transcript_119159:42-857(-)
MYSEDDLVVQRYIQQQHEEDERNVVSPEQALFRMASGDNQLQSQALVADAMARAIVAREQSKTAVALAECAVRMKEIDVMGKMEMTKVAENASVERCKIQQEHQSQRFARMADVWELATKEQASTIKETSALKEGTKRQAVAAKERVDVARIKLEASTFNSISAALTMMFGALGARTLLGWIVPIRRGKRHTGVPWLSLLFLFCGGYLSSRLPMESLRPHRVLVSVVRLLMKYMLPSGIPGMPKLQQKTTSGDEKNAAHKSSLELTNTAIG